MSCNWCAHFCHPDNPTQDRTDYLSRVGQCRLNPEWKDVRADHVCGQFAWKNESWLGNTTACAYYYNQLGERNVSSHKMKYELSRLRVANKVLRAKIKLLQGGPQ
jgi:hypothetical protein